mmetsp:Transcript_9158/g.13527  ORF Transcript_9158/g.13527 Transcript_9158/m.13527 type:complete len:443 (+) Transcript_9158:187-1515(+)
MKRWRPMVESIGHYPLGDLHDELRHAAGALRELRQALLRLLLAQQKGKHELDLHVVLAPHRAFDDRQCVRTILANVQCDVLHSHILKLLGKANRGPGRDGLVGCSMEQVDRWQILSCFLSMLLPLVGLQEQGGGAGGQVPVDSQYAEHLRIQTSGHEMRLHGLQVVGTGHKHHTFESLDRTAIILLAIARSRQQPMLDHQHRRQVSSSTLSVQNHVVHVAAEGLDVGSNPSNGTSHVFHHVRHLTNGIVPVVDSDEDHTSIQQTHPELCVPAPVPHHPSSAHDSDHHRQLLSTAGLCRCGLGRQVNVQEIASVWTVADTMDNSVVEEVGIDILQGCWGDQGSIDRQAYHQPNGCEAIDQSHRKQRKELPHFIGDILDGFLNLGHHAALASERRHAAQHLGVCPAILLTLRDEADAVSEDGPDSLISETVGRGSHHSFSGVSG